MKGGAKKKKNSLENRTKDELHQPKRKMRQGYYKKI